MITEVKKESLINAVVIEFADCNDKAHMQEYAENIQKETGYRTHYICKEE